MIGLIYCQDHDGSHIKGLIINYLDHFYPSLLKVPKFLVEFVTPIVRVGLSACLLLVAQAHVNGTLGHERQGEEEFLHHPRVRAMA